MIKIRSFLLLIAVLCTCSLFAQNNATSGNIQMADGMMSSGKIYVVVAVVLIILAGLLLYLISVDRKITKLEKEIEKDKKQ